MSRVERQEHRLLRASDADRDREIEELTRHAELGRLDSLELVERIDQTMSAKTLGELEDLVADLPLLPPPPPRPAPGPVPRSRLALLTVSNGVLAVLFLVVSVAALLAHQPLGLLIAGYLLLRFARIVNRGPGPSQLPPPPPGTWSSPS
jgi:hypothetical protein